MRTIKKPIVAAPFEEHPVVNCSIKEPKEYEVWNAVTEKNNDFMSEGSFDLEQYCQSLLHKLTRVNKSKIKPFLQFQCNLLQDPIHWLNKLEKLIDLNREYFTTKEHNIKIEKALMVIELLRDAEQQKPRSENRYDFDRVKRKLNEIESSEERLMHLMELKTEYLQNKPAFINTKEVPFDEKVDLEIALIKNQSKIKRKRQSLSVPRVDKTPTRKEKFKINTNVNQFVDVFFQLMNEKKVDGKPYLEANLNEMALMISENFKDKEGKDIPADTIKTVLWPSRFDKRPKEGKRIDLL